MKAEELRIGNLVLDEDKEVVRVEAIAGDLIHEFTRVSKKLDSGRYQVYGSNIYAITLTEQWLINLGFSKFKNREIWSKGRFLVYKNRQLGLCFGPSGNRVTIKSIHQLQNLYFALTGEELTIKKKES